MSSAFTFDISDVMKKLDSISSRMSAGLDIYGDIAARKMEAYAKANRPWTDRTSHAKQSIRGTSQRKGNELTIQLSGGMDYSPYLEFAMNKKYAILYPTLQKHQKEILSGLKNVMR